MRCIDLAWPHPIFFSLLVPDAGVLIPSTPGYHKIQDCGIGHLKLRREIERLAPDDDDDASSDSDDDSDENKNANKAGSIICQFSSIGSLTKKYLHRLQYSMDISRSRRDSSSEDDESKPLKLQLVYPTADEICNSVEGYRGGLSVPGTLKNVSKDFLQPLFRKWTAPYSLLASLALSRNDEQEKSKKNPLLKGNNVPHIKSYFQLSDSEGEGMAWFMLSSHNLSKAAWGDVQNSSVHGEKRLFVRSWELGVFISPQHLRANRLVPWTPEKNSTDRTHGKDATIPLPYHHRPHPYSESDKPWAVDSRHVRLDRFGRRSAADP